MSPSIIVRDRRGQLSPVVRLYHQNQEVDRRLQTLAHTIQSPRDRRVGSQAIWIVRCCGGLNCRCALCAVLGSLYLHRRCIRWMAVLRTLDHDRRRLSRRMEQSQRRSPRSLGGARNKGLRVLCPACRIPVADRSPAGRMTVSGQGHSDGLLVRAARSTLFSHRCLRLAPGGSLPSPLFKRTPMRINRARCWTAMAVQRSRQTHQGPPP